MFLIHNKVISLECHILQLWIVFYLLLNKLFTFENFMHVYDVFWPFEPPFSSTAATRSRNLTFHSWEHLDL